MRTTKPGKAVNQQTLSDNEVLFGEISEHTVTSLNTMINSVYKPMVATLETTEWGACEQE